MICDDGRTARIRFTRLTSSSGYGLGVTNQGEPLQFTFGLDDAKAKQYISLPASRSARAPAGASSGTGFFIDGNGTVVTNFHVVDECRTITVSTLGGVSSEATLIVGDKGNDIALLRTAQRGTPFAAIRTLSQARQGESVVVFGFPLAQTLSDGGNLTTGIVSALSGLGNDTRYLQISAPVQPGNSGGPLLDQSGNVIGIVTAKLDAVRTTIATGDIPQNVNFAINASMLRSFFSGNDVNYRESAVEAALSTIGVADKARAFSVKIACRA